MEDKEIGERIRARREFLNRRRGGFSREDLAAKLGITRAGYAHWELGRRAINARDIERIARILECSVAYFFDAPEDSGHRPTEEEDEAIVLKYYRGIPPDMRAQARKVLRAFIAEDRDYAESRNFGKKAE